MRKTPKQIREQLNKLIEEQRAMLDEDFTDELRVRFDELDAEIKTMEGDLDRAKRAEERQTEPVGLGEPQERANITDVRDLEAEKPFRNLGEQLICVARAGRSENRDVDPRLKKAEAQARAASGLNEAVPSDGGFLVQTDFASGLIKKAHDTGRLVGMVDTTPISANANGLVVNGYDETSRADGSRRGGVRSYWADEAATVTASAPTFRRIELKLNKLFALYYATDELLQDATALEAEVESAFAEEMGFKYDDAIINGSGAGQPLGVYNAACLVSVAKETGQAADTITAENIEKMYSRMWAPSVRNGVWLINQDCWPQIFQLHHAVGTGGVPMFVPAGGLNQTPYGTLLGRPIMPIEQCQTLGDKGDIYFVDLSQYKMIEKGGNRMESSIHVRFLYDESVFRFIARVDGQPKWNSALTPFKGSATQSPFITLAARA